MTERKSIEVEAFPITDENGNELMIGSKRIMGVHANRWNMLTIKLEGGGELPDELKDQIFTNYKLCREVIGNYLRAKQHEEDNKRSYHKSRKPKEDEVESEDAKEASDS